MAFLRISPRRAAVALRGNRCVSALGLGLLLAVILSPAAMAAGQSAQQRIVAVGGAITEILFALGAEQHLVGADTTSLWPPAALDLPRVGYQRTLSAEGVLSLGPTLLLGTVDAGPPATLKQLGEAGLDIQILEYARSPQGVADAVQRIAAIVGRESEGAEIVARLQAGTQQLGRVVDRQAGKPRVLFLFVGGRGTPMVSGRNTVADAMIKLSGGVNAVEAYEGFKPLNPESIIVANPDLVLLTKRTLDMTGGEDKIFSLPGIATTTAGRERQLLAMDGLYLLGFGPRVTDAAIELNRRMHQVVGD